MCWPSNLTNHYSLFKYRYTKYNYGSRLSHVPDKPSASVFRFDIPSISLDILDILFSISLLLSEKLGITITNALYLVFCTKNMI